MTTAITTTPELRSEHGFVFIHRPDTIYILNDLQLMQNLFNWNFQYHSSSDMGHLYVGKDPMGGAIDIGERVSYVIGVIRFMNYSNNKI